MNHERSSQLPDIKSPMGAHPESLLIRRRKICGMSAILLPFLDSGEVDWQSLEAHIERTIDAGLIPAVNMDTGYANFIDEAIRRRVLETTRAVCNSEQDIPFVAGVFVGDRKGDSFDLDQYARGMEQVEAHGGLPIVFQSFGLTKGSDNEIVERYQTLADRCDRFLGFELSQAFAPFGKIYSLELFEQLLKIPACIGLKHSSLKRQPEWDRLAIRNRVRPEFRILTGNDLAIDMVMYGSDYLLGLSTFAPDLFAKRDEYWRSGDQMFYELNDVLQYLGQFAFREPVPAYKHSAAMFLQQRGWIKTDRTHPKSPSRPDSDRQVLY